MTRLDVARRRLSTIKFRFLESVLEGCVAGAVPGTFESDEQQDQFQDFVRGLSIVYLFSFLQSHIGNAAWGEIKRAGSSARAESPNVNWDLFDLFMRQKVYLKLDDLKADEKV